MFGAPSPLYNFYKYLFSLLTILIPTLSLIFWFLLRKRKWGRKIVIVFFALAFVIDIVILELSGELGPSRVSKAINSIIYWKRSVIQEVPIDIQEKANAHISAILGKKYYDKYIYYQPGNSYKNGTNSYRLIYKFEPYENYGGFSIQADVTNGNVSLDKYKIVLPNCSLDETLCQFNLSSQEYEDLIYKYNADDTVYFKPPFIYVELCPEKKYLKINYITKEVDDTVKSYKPYPNGINLGPCPVVYY